MIVSGISDIVVPKVKKTNTTTKKEYVPPDPVIFTVDEFFKEKEKNNE
jgi:hypothetical protein